MDNSLGKYLPPIFPLHSQQIFNMIFHYDSELNFLGEKTSNFLQLIKESNGHIAVGNKLGKIGQILGPKLQNSSKELKFSTNYMSTIANMHRGKPSTGDLFHTL
jgi:hypothetical protein